MKIVAIRGKNLASLEGEFSVEFEQAPLARAGLFAITGPTGAGKSTILDALCLALFDEIPRLPTGQGVSVGRADEDDSLRTKSNDVRSILRRGAADGYAEVEFVGCDNQSYLAHWEVRRARNSASGRLQAQVMTLTALANNQLIGRTKGEVQQAIQERLGLSFEQFRRSVLLAQGDFASFLKADAKQRSELLERMTGTEIYGLLSKAAHARSAHEENEMKRLELRMGDFLPMPAEARISLEDQFKTAQVGQAQLDQSWLAIKRVIDWYERLAQLKVAESDAIAKVATADQVVIDASDRRKEFELIQLVQPSRAMLERMDQSNNELIDSEKTLVTARTEELQTAKCVSELLQTVETEKARLTKQENELALIEPDLREARVLDTQLSGALAEQESCKQIAIDAKKKADIAAGKQAESVTQNQIIEKVLTESTQWLQANQHNAELANQWQRWDQELTNLVEADHARQRATSELTALGAALLLVQPELTAATAQQTELNAAVSDVEKKIAILEVQAKATSLAALQQGRVGLQTRQNGLRTLLALHNNAVDTNKQLDTVAIEQAHNQTESVRLQADIQKLNEHLIASRSALAEVERSHHLFMSARKADVETLRDELLADEPCPVCGSTEHPWVSSEPKLDLLLNDMTSRVQTLRDEVSNSTRELGRLETEHATAIKFISEFESKRTELSGVLVEHISKWNAACNAEQLSKNVLAIEVKEQLLAKMQEVESALVSITEQENQAHRLQTTLQEKQLELRQFRLVLTTTVENIASLTLQLQKLNHDHEQQTRELARAVSERKQIVDKLTPVLIGVENWQRKLEDNVPSLRQTCDQIVMQWHQKTQQRDESSNGLATQQALLAAASTEATHMLENSNNAQSMLLAVQANLTDLQAQRKTLLAGRAADQVETELKAVITSAGNALKIAQTYLVTANEQLAVNRKTIQHQQAEHDKRIAAKTQAETGINAALVKYEMGLDRLRQLLMHGEAWLRTEQAELNGIQTQLLEAKAIHTALQQQRLKYEADNQPTLSMEDANSQLADTETLCLAAQDKIADIRASLKQDDEKQSQGVALRAELETQKEKWQLWASLKDLIGSQDGSKFRTFAQSLTLDALLGYANRHLEELARRYLLQRVPGSDLELQVIDQEMGDEVRSVHSLSGGESFLISLALALGLASLSSNRTQVESLFIDEGFGSLDPATLDIAIASLDALQSLGRKVGVISHVPAMVERIGVQVRVGVHGGGKSSVKTVGAFMD
jgi:exonuclease SbcC